MDSDQKLMELQKAYANMILNTTKEAAARVLVSDRKAFRLESELKRTKEDAICMLTRLKQMMDIKMTEAEMASRAQQTKIEELEAQLHEAEDIVKDLREELSLAHGKLGRASRKEEVKLMVQVDKAQNENIFNTPNSNTCPPPQKEPYSCPNFDKDRSNIGQKLYNPSFPFMKTCINDQNLPSIILRSKGTKRYLSGCTQRVHACEQKNHIQEDLITKADEGQKLQNGLFLVNEKREIRKRSSPNKKQRSSCPNQKENDHVTDNSYLTTRMPVKYSKEKSSVKDTNVVTDLVGVNDWYKLVRKELHLMENQKTELPLGLEAQIDPPQANDLEAGIPIQSLITFQRKRKRDIMSSDEDDFSNKLKKKEENKDDVSETKKVISIEKATPDETQKVNSRQESSQEETERVVSTEESAQEEIPLNQIAQQLISFSETTSCNGPRSYVDNKEVEDASSRVLGNSTLAGTL